MKSFRLALRNCLARKGISILSLVTITLGSAALTSTIIVNENVNYYIDAMIAQFGGPILKIRLRGKNDYFTPSLLQEMRATVDAVATYEDGYVYSMKVRYLDNFQTADMQMIANDFIQEDAKVIGERIKTLDRDSNYVNVSKQLAKRLKIEPSDLPKTIVLTYGTKSIPVRVKGIYHPDEMVLLDQGTVFTPQYVFDYLTNSIRPRMAVVKIEDLARLERAQEQLKPMLEKLFRDRVVYFSSQTRIESTQKRLKNLIWSGILLGLIATLAGSIGLMTQMLLTVRIRKKEIGLYRAIGFSSRQIISQFLFEFLVLSGTGAFVGSMIGIWTGKEFSLVVIYPFSNVSPLAIVAGFALTVLVSLAFSLFPALTASRLEPVEALRG